MTTNTVLAPARRRTLAVAAATLVAVGALAAPVGPAGASHEPGPDALCGGDAVTFWPNSGLWGVKKERGSPTTYLPVARSVTAHDLTNDVEYGPFVEEKGNGRAHPGQDTVECTYTVHEHGTVNPFTGEIVDVDFHLTIWAVRRP